MLFRIETIKDAPIGRVFARLLQVSEKETCNKNSSISLIRFANDHDLSVHSAEYTGHRELKIAEHMIIETDRLFCEK